MNGADKETEIAHCTHMIKYYLDRIGEEIHVVEYHNVHGFVRTIEAYAKHAKS